MFCRFEILFFICGICVWAGVFQGETCILYLCKAKGTGIHVQICLGFGEL